MIRIEKISKSFGGQRVLDRVSFTLPRGEVTALTGASGSGKTTLMHILLGLIQPDSGTVAGLDELRVAAVFQEDRLIQHMSARENVSLVCDSYELSSELLNALDLPANEPKRVLKYSGGMRRRVAIARALSVRPDALLLDEPFKGLDEASREKTIEVILDRARNAAILLISHDPEDARLMHAAGFVSLG